MPLLSGGQVKAICRHFSPFCESGELRPEEERVTILAANAFQPLDVMSRAFASAAARDGGSPLLVQISFSALRSLGRRDFARGAGLARAIIEGQADQCGAAFVGMTLDHFRVPDFPIQDGGRPDELEVRVARARLDDAVEAARGLAGCEVTSEAVDEYVRYMTAPAYRAFRGSFLQAVASARPAWAMIDTERLPPVLDFAVTRDVVEAVRECLGDRDVILEAEFGATGSSGDEIPYVQLSGDALKGFARGVAAFVGYTGADAIAYPIGMEHAARIGETHEPDVERLEVVHREVLQTVGRYVPFAQHGGTGAASLARGLVGKNNVATRFLVVAANYLADYTRDNLDGIRAGVKAACGVAMYEGMTEAVAGATVEKLKECGSYGRGPEVAGILGFDRPDLPVPGRGYEAPADVE